MGATNWTPALLTMISTEPKVFFRLGDEARDLIRLRHVGAVEGDLRSRFLFHAGAFALDVFRFTEAVEHHVRARFGKRSRHALADTAGGACDDRCFAFEHGGNPFIVILNAAKNLEILQSSAVLSEGQYATARPEDQAAFREKGRKGMGIHGPGAPRRT